MILPQYLASETEVSALREVARNANATFIEIVLTTSLDDALARYCAVRIQQDALRMCIDEVVESWGGSHYLKSLYDDLFDAVSKRPDAVPIASLVDDIDGTFALLMTALTEHALSDLPG